MQLPSIIAVTPGRPTYDTAGWWVSVQVGTWDDGTPRTDGTWWVEDPAPAFEVVGSFMADLDAFEDERANFPSDSDCFEDTADRYGPMGAAGIDGAW